MASKIRCCGAQCERSGGCSRIALDHCELVCGQRVAASVVGRSSRHTKAVWAIAQWYRACRSYCSFGSIEREELVELAESAFLELHRGLRAMEFSLSISQCGACATRRILGDADLAVAG